MSNRSKVGKDFVNKDKEKSELRAKAKAKEKLNKSGPPSKKELVDKARDLMSKRETKRSSAFPHASEQSRKDLKKFQMTSKASRDVGDMLNKRIKRVGQSDLLSNVSDPLFKRQKLIKELKKSGAAKQIPKSMNKGGIVKMQGGGAATRGINFNRGY